jgi:hypothetical protein
MRGKKVGDDSRLYQALFQIPRGMESHGREGDDTT